MTAYLILTNPFGSGEESHGSVGGPSGGGNTRTAIDANQPGAAAVLAPMSSHVVVVDREYVDADVRDLLDPNYRPNRRAHEEVIKRGNG